MNNEEINELINLVLTKGKLRNKETQDILYNEDGVFKILLGESNQYKGEIHTITNFSNLAPIGKWEYYDFKSNLITIVNDEAKPLLCKVDDNDDEFLIQIITNISNREKYSYAAFYYGENASERYKNAEPLTAKEIHKLYKNALDYEKLRKITKL